MDLTATRRTMNTPIWLASCVFMAIALVAPAWADVNRDQAAATAQRQTGGRVLSVDRTESARRPVWRVKVVTPQGEVRVMLIDVATGRTIETAAG